MKGSLPTTQFALQLVAPSQLRLNEAKVVVLPGPRQIVCRVEAVGLCFSDMKLLQQFSRHGRKGAVAAGIEPETLSQIPSYVPDDKPTVPGHEAVVRVCAVGGGVERYQPGERYLVQTDYRWLPTTKGSNAAFGYNFEGALQEYVLMDERIITSPEGESLLIRVPEHLSASAVALVEPWACVEDAYATKERRQIVVGGRMLLAVEPGRKAGAIERLLSQQAPPREVVLVAENDFASASLVGSGARVTRARSLEELAGSAFDDIVYLGARAEVARFLDGLLAHHGLLNLVLGGSRIGREVTLRVGRLHYAGTRIVGTTTEDPSDSMRHIAPKGEIRPGEMIHVVGAAGPMGTMHVIRNLCQGVPDVTVVASDLDEERLQALSAKARRLAERYGQRFAALNPNSGNGREEYTYTVVMVPLPGLVSAAVASSAEGGIINVFAGIPPDVTAEVDMDRYVQRRLYMIGTSGSVIEDMRTVLRRLGTGLLDTNISVGAISGMRGALDGLEAVRTRVIPGKIIVYPQLHELGLLTLTQLKDRFPSVYGKLDEGVWSSAAEAELLLSAAD